MTPSKAIKPCPPPCSEDILDDVSGLTVDSPDATVEEGSRLVPQCPGGDPPKDLHPNQAEHKVRKEVSSNCQGVGTHARLELKTRSTSCGGLSV